MQKAGAGVLIYLDQEGRGSGLFAKARGYQLTKDSGMDTFSAYRHLELPEDSRSYEDAVELLKKLKLRYVTLMTNNPDKVMALKAAGIDVAQRPLVINVENEHARSYLAAKARSGHTIPVCTPES
jgi:3,4-dihydroxy 2-butanone 4-phosphate synthase/GTP cyclohydrolase II